MPSPRTAMGRRAARILITAALSLVASGTDLMERPGEPDAPPVLSEGERDPRPAGQLARSAYPSGRDGSSCPRPRLPWDCTSAGRSGRSPPPPTG